MSHYMNYKINGDKNCKKIEKFSRTAQLAQKFRKQLFESQKFINFIINNNYIRTLKTTRAPF